MSLPFFMYMYVCLRTIEKWYEFDKSDLFALVRTMLCVSCLNYNHDTINKNIQLAYHVVLVSEMVGENPRTAASRLPVLAGVWNSRRPLAGWDDISAIYSNVIQNQSKTYLFKGFRGSLNYWKSQKKSNWVFNYSFAIKTPRKNIMTFYNEMYTHIWPETRELF